MRKEKPDRTPVMCQLSIGHMIRVLGTSPAEFWFDRTTYVEGLLAIRELYGFDGILVSLHGHDPNWRNDVVEIEDRENGQLVRWRNGSETFCPNDDLPFHTPAQSIHPLNISELDPERDVELPIRYIPVSQGLHFSISEPSPFGSLQQILEMAGDEFSVHGEVTSPFDYLLDALGHQEGLMALLLEPEQCEMMLDRYAKGVAEIARMQARIGVDAIKLSSPFAGMGFISPAHYRRFVLPYERIIVEAVHEEKVPIYTHTCGAIGDRLEMMVEAGVDGIECLDPPPLGNVELADAASRIGGQVFIKGNLDSVNLLLRGSEEEVGSEVRRTLEVGSTMPGFILSTACSVAPAVSPETLKILRRIVDKQTG